MYTQVPSIVDKPTPQPSPRACLPGTAVADYQQTVYIYIYNTLCTHR